MSLVKIDVDADNVLSRQFTELERKNLPFAIVQAVNATAFEIRQVWARTAARVFDRPRAMTINAAQYTKATKQRLYATIFLRDEAPKGTAPVKYLFPEVEGGERNETRFERALRFAGKLPSGMSVVPGKGVKLDPVIASFGELKVDPLPLTEIAKHRKQASELVDKVGFDN